MRIALTGADGFLGSHLCRFLRDHGSSVTALVLKSSPLPQPVGVGIIRSSFSDPRELADQLKGHDVLINLAGNMRGARAKPYFDANIKLVQTLILSLKRMDRPPRLFHFSSVAAIGPSPSHRLLKENDPPHPISLYGKTKAIGEKLLRKAASQIPITILRLCSLYGPGDRCFLALFSLAGKGYFPRLCTRSKRFQLLHVEDSLPLLQQIVSHPPSNVLLHVGNPAVTTDSDLYRALGKAAGKTLKELFVPRSVARVAGRLYDLLEQLTGHSDLMSSSKIEEMSDPNWTHDYTEFVRQYAPTSFTSLEEGVEKTFSWYRENGWL